MNKNTIFLIILLVLITKKNHADNKIFDMIKSYLPTNPIILEAGAYNGTDSISLADYWKDGQVYAFEPIPELYDSLNEKKQQRTNIKFYQLALGDTIGILPMYVSSWNTNPNSPSGSSSLLAPKEHLTHAPEVIFNKTINVPVTTIDQWAKENGINHIDFMWLDMQGYELNALKASPAILSTVKVIITEVEFVEAYQGQYLFKDVKQWLEEHGFTMITYVNHYGWFGDALFIRI